MNQKLIMKKNEKLALNVLFINQHYTYKTLVTSIANSVWTTLLWAKTLEDWMWILANKKVNMICVDTNVGSWDWLKFIKFVRKYGKYNLIPICIFSHQKWEDIVNSWKTIWADDYISIPFTGQRILISFYRWAELTKFWSQSSVLLEKMDSKSSRLVRVTSSLVVNTFSQLLWWDKKISSPALVFDDIKWNIADLVDASTNQSTLNFIESLQENWWLYHHSLKVASLLWCICSAFKEEYGFTKEQLNEIFLWWFLHDIGYHTLNLDDYKWKILPPKVLSSLYSTHIENAKIIVESMSDFIPEIAKHIMLDHHERIDGSWPRWLKWEEISPVAQIAGIVDWFCDRKWKFIWSKWTWFISSNLILEEIKSSWGFDPEIFSKVESILSMV